MTKDKALDLALEALEIAAGNGPHDYPKYSDAITAIKQARALDKKAENARELGLDYEFADGTQVSKVWWDGEKLMAKPIPLVDFYQPVQDSTCRETLRAQGKAYPRTCRKCGLGPCIGAPKQPPAAQPAPVQEPVAWKWHQAPVKTQWGDDMVVADLAIDKDNTVSVYCERDQTTKVVAMFTPPAAQRQWVGLTDEEILKLAYPIRWQEVDDFEADKAINFAQMVEAKLKEKNT